MSYAESSDVAWDLVEHGRATMNIAELNAAFVRLGVGEDREAIEIALKSMCRAAGPRLPDELLARLTRLAQVGFFNRHVMDLLAVVSRAGTHYPRSCSRPANMAAPADTAPGRPARAVDIRSALKGPGKQNI